MYERVEVYINRINLSTEKSKTTTPMDNLSDISEYVPGKIKSQNLGALRAYLQREIAAQNISLHELARRSGRHASTVHQAVSGSTGSIEIETLRDLSDGLGIPLTTLINILLYGDKAALAPLEKKEIALPAVVWESLRRDAYRNDRTWDKQLKAILLKHLSREEDGLRQILSTGGGGLEGYPEANVNLNAEEVPEKQKTSAKKQRSRA